MVILTHILSNLATHTRGTIVACVVQSDSSFAHCINPLEYTKFACGNF